MNFDSHDTVGRLSLAGLALLLFLIALSFRLPGLSKATLQVDEIHWKNRSEQVLDVYSRGDWRHLTGFLPHPGVPPAILMAASQQIARIWNARHGDDPGHAKHIDPYTASRAACAFTVAVFVPLLFLLLYPLIGVSASLLTALLFAVDPNVVGVSRLAHLDAVMAAFVVTSAVLYFRGVEAQSLPLKILSGLFWGLALVTKPTAVALPVAFFVYRGCRVLNRERTGEQGLFHWSDLWALLVGHLIFAAVYTRMWSHSSEYHWKFQMHSSFADAVWGASHFLNGYAVAASLLLAALAVCLIWKAWRRYAGGEALTAQGWAYGVAAVATLLLLLATAAPAVLENFVYFWMRVSGLHSVVHESIGYVAAAMPGGYAEILFRRLPTPTVLLALIGGYLSLKSLRGNDRCARFQLFAIVVLLVWIALLSTSQKQAFRYLVPVTPFLFFFASIPIVRLQARMRLAVPAVSFLLVVFAARSFWALFPDTLIHYNSLSGGLQTAFDRGVPIPIAGSREAIQFLRETYSIDRAHPMTVGAVAEIDALEHEDRRFFHDDAESLRFRMLTKNLFDEVVLLSRPMEKGYTESQGIHYEVVEILQRTVVDGVELSAVARIAPLSYSTPVDVPLSRWHRSTGELSLAKDVGALRGPLPEKLLVADPARHSKGFLFFGDGFRFGPGKYQFDLYASAWGGVEGSDGNTVLEWQLGSVCKRNFTLKELRSDVLTPHRIECDFPSGFHGQLRGYWFPVGGVAIDRVVVQQLSGEPS